MSKMKDFEIAIYEFETTLNHESNNLERAWRTMYHAVQTKDLRDMIETRKIVINRVANIATRLEQIVRAEFDTRVPPNPHSTPNSQSSSQTEFDFTGGDNRGES